MPSDNINTTGFNSTGDFNLLDAALLASFALMVKNTERDNQGIVVSHKQYEEMTNRLDKINNNLEKMIELLEKNLTNT